MLFIQFDIKSVVSNDMLLIEVYNFYEFILKGSGEKTMIYKYAENKNYEDFASGRVLYGHKGVTNFPVRLSQEIFRRCLEYSYKKKDIVLYDCCCGTGYMLTVLGFLNQGIISSLIGSDINKEFLEIAGKNLSLLSYDGIENRIRELEDLVEHFNKQSHKDALASANKLKELIVREIHTEIFQADIYDLKSLYFKPDIIMADVPYGDMVNWEGVDGSVDSLLDSLYSLCEEHTIIGLCMSKKQKVTNNPFKLLEKQNVGKRKFVILNKS